MYRKLLVFAVGVSVLLLVFVSLFGFALETSASARSWAQVSSNQDQSPAAEPLTFNQIDGAEGVVVGKDSIEVNKGGLYLVVIAPQVTAKVDGGCFEAWLRLNGKDVDNSNVLLCQSKAGDTDVVVSQGVLDLNKGDKLQFIGNADGAYADAIKSAAGGPLIPSHITSIAPIGN
jgi:hypothetical protein